MKRKLINFNTQKAGHLAQVIRNENEGSLAFNEITFTNFDL